MSRAPCRASRAALRRHIAQAIATRDHAAFSTMIYAGLRIEKAIALTVDDLSFARGTEEVRVAKDKGNKERLVLMGPRLKRSLRRCLRARDVLMCADVEVPLPHLFLTEKGSRITEGTLRRRLYGWIREACPKKADLALKRNRSHTIVAGASATALGIGATPIPFSDAVLLVPVQVGMLASISAVTLSTLVASAAGAAATLTGRAVVGGLLKRFPGVGTLIGGTIAGTTAAALTVSLGESYIAALDALFRKNEGEPPTEEEVVAEVKRRFSKGGGETTAPDSLPEPHLGGDSRG